MGYTYNEYDENPVRRTLKQRKKRKLKRKFKVLLVVFFVSLIAFFLLSDYSKVKEIQINGIDITTPKEILENISISQSSYYFMINQDKIKEEIETLPTIKKAQVDVDWKGNVSIDIEEATMIAYANINNQIYEINDIGRIVKVNDQKRIQKLKAFPFVQNFSSEKLLQEFAEGFYKVPTLFQNEMSEILLEPKPGDQTSLKCLMKDDKIVYVRIEDLATRLNDDQFNYEAYKTKYKDKRIFSIEGNYIYIPN